jgi:hypothetical protein
MCTIEIAMAAAAVPATVALLRSAGHQHVTVRAAS